MMDNEHEEEIKIVYFESIEDDPLLEKIEIESHKNSNRPVLSNNNEKNVVNTLSDRSMDNLSFENNKTGAVYENKDSKDQENTAKWYKLIDDLGKYVCKICDLSYSTVQTLRYHVKIKHNNYYQETKTIFKNKRQCKIKCYICNIKFKKVTELKMHTQTHGLENVKNICYICYATFEEDTDLLNHLTNKHEINKKLHICSTCGYSTQKAYHYRQHLNIHTKKDLIKCYYCSYTTNRRTNLRIHEQTHSRDRPFVCEYEGCEYRCTTSAALRSHSLIHNKEKYMLYCDRCSYSTIYVQNLNKHLDSHRRNKVRKKV